MNADRRNTIVFAILSVAAVLAGCGGQAPEGGSAVAEGAPSGVLLVVLGDTGVADEAAVAAQEAFGGVDTVVFERHYTAATDTASALLSMLTGYPVLAWEDQDDETTPDRPTLAELFSRMGYSTFGVVAGDPSLLGSGIERGFEEYRFEAEASTDDLIAGAVDGIGRASGAYLGLLRLPRADRTTVSALAAALDGVDSFENTLLVVTADHGPDDQVGETFDARLREAVTHVPLLVRFPPGQRPETLAPRTTSLTSGLDILPSLVALAGRDISEALPGSNILDGFFSGYALVESPDAWAFLQDDYKLIVSGEKALVFDLATDPQEQRDLAAEMTERSRALLTGAIQTRTAMTSGRPGQAEGEDELDPETLEHLRSLGYVQ